MEESQRAAVLEELERILASPAFRGTRRSREFLRYVVTGSLEGRLDALKERTIGAEVFGRPADYDTGDDSIVRVKASEVRKRLAQYYQEAGPRPVEIDVPAGSYTPEFRWRPATAPVPPARFPRRWLAAALLAVTAAAAAVAWFRRGGVLEEFWQPFFHSSRPVTLCVAHPAVYRLSGATGQMVRDPDHYVGVGDALALAQLATRFSRSAKPARLRAGDDTSFADLRNGPAVLIGAYTNQWTLEIMRDLRFVFDRDAASIWIRDRRDPTRRWTYALGTDYAVVSRIFDSKTGEPVVVAAGLSHYGTQVAGEFLTSETYLAPALRGAPAGWARRNLQLVLKADVIGKTPGPPQVVASWFW